MSRKKRYIATLTIQFKVESTFADVSELKSRLIEKAESHEVHAFSQIGSYYFCKDKAKKSLTLHELKPNPRKKK